MREDQETVLVCFIGILRRISSLCCECKLSDTIIKLFISLPWLDLMLRSWNLFRYRGSYVIQNVGFIAQFRPRVACNIHCVRVFLCICSTIIFLFLFITTLDIDIWLLRILLSDTTYIFARCWRLSTTTVSLLRIDQNLLVRFMFLSTLYCQRPIMRLFSCRFFLYHHLIVYLLIYILIGS